MPFGIPDRSGHPALRYSSNRLQVRLGCVPAFRLRARLDFSIRHGIPGQRGITPAFGYGAPHPSAEGTSTPLNSRAAQHTLRAPPPPHSAQPVPRGRLVNIIPDHALGLPVLRALSLCTCAASTPVQRLGVVFAHLTQPYQPSPKLQSGRPAHRPFRGLRGVYSRCGPHTRAVTYT